MMKRPVGTGAFLAIMALLLLGGSAAHAADGYVTTGYQWWDQTQPEAKYQEFREMPQGVFVESFLYQDRLLNGNLSAWGSNAIRSDQTLAGTYRRPRWTASIDYIQVPHNLSFVSSTGYTFLDPATQTLPDSLQRQNQENPTAYTSTMSDFLQDAHPIDLGFRTDLIQSSLRARPGGGFDVELRGLRRNRTGGKPYGGSFGFSNAVEVVEPIRQSMAEAEGRVSYTKSRFTAEGSFLFSGFENDHSTLIWDNSRRITDAVGNPAQGRLDFYPDNQQWRATGRIGIQMPRRTAFQGIVSYGESSQNDDWLPYTINSVVFSRTDSFPLPGTSTDAKALLTTVDARLTSHIVNRVGATARFYWNKYDNRTPHYLFEGQVPYDGSWSGTDVENHAFGNEKRIYGADVDWNPVRLVGLSATVEQIDRRHTFREVPEDQELAWRGRARLRPTNTILATGEYRHGEREIEHFEEEDYQNDLGQFIEQPELRRFDVADRIQDKAEATLGWTGIPSLGLSLRYSYLRNDYHETELGLVDYLQRSAGLTASYAATTRLDFTGSFSWSKIYTQQNSRESSTGTLRLDDSTNWTARLTDDLISAEAGATYQLLPDRFLLMTNYFYDRAPGTYDLSNFRGTAQDLPSTLYFRQGVEIETRWTMQANTDLSLRWQWEEFEAIDFQNEDIPLLFPLTGASNAIFLGDSVLDYHANAVALLFSRRF
jgi:MtrB/PioB family decaheme-associated outer membrane protein